MATTFGARVLRKARRTYETVVNPLPAQKIDVIRALIGATRWQEAAAAIGDDAELAFHLGSDFLVDDPARGVFCRRLAATIAPDEILYTLPLAWLELECASARQGHALASDIGKDLHPGAFVTNKGVVSAIIDRDTLGAHIEVLRAIDRMTIREGNYSATTPRFRYELVYHLLDNAARGPIIELGIARGGLAAVLLYVAAITGRRYIGIDVDPAMMVRAQATCRRFGLEGHGSFYRGTLAEYVAAHGWVARPDLVFIDSSHDYLTTRSELNLVHGQPPIDAAPSWPRAVALHDFNYRMLHQQASVAEGRFAQDNPTAVDHACHDFLVEDFAGPPPLLKRIGAFTGDGVQATPRNPGALSGDYVDFYGSEGMLLLHACP